MKVKLLKRFGLLFIGVVMIVTLSLPTFGAQGRGRGRGLSKKSVKFVNGHDARNGRFDGRGPRPRLVRTRWLSRRDRRRPRWVRIRHRRPSRLVIR